jgi:hypothetical protein
MNTYGRLFPSAEPGMADRFDAGYKPCSACLPTVAPLHAI